MNIANCNGTSECHSLHELEKYLRKSSTNPFDDIWLNIVTDYPCLAILINGDYSCIHYFLNDKGDMWQSVGYGDRDVTFVMNGEKTAMPADAVVSLEKAIQCAKQFFNISDKPTCIEWREL